MLPSRALLVSGDQLAQPMAARRGVEVGASDRQLTPSLDTPERTGPMENKRGMIIRDLSFAR